MSQRDNERKPWLLKFTVFLAVSCWMWYEFIKAATAILRRFQ